MIIEEYIELPYRLANLPEVGYSIVNKGLNLKLRACAIQEEMRDLDIDLAALLEEVSTLWNEEERKDVGL